MAVAGWSWNLMNLMALPLMLGAGVDYTIFIQLALRRHGGDLGLVRRSVGRALMLCGATAMAGFGSLGWSSNPGMASLGRVCAVGIGANMIISVFLLPAWWVWLNQKAEGRRLKAEGNPKFENGDRPSRTTQPPDSERSKFEVQSSRFKVSSLTRQPPPLAHLAPRTTQPPDSERSKFEVQSSRFKVSSPTLNSSSFYRAGLWR